MYRFERGLPQLPVPTLEETATKYLQSVKAFHVADPTNKEFQNTENAVNKFKASPLVKELQTRLEQRAAEKSSWLSEWWNDHAYMSYRGPVVPWVVRIILFTSIRSSVLNAGSAELLLRSSR